MKKALKTLFQEKNTTVKKAQKTLLFFKTLTVRTALVLCTVHLRYLCDPDLQKRY